MQADRDDRITSDERSRHSTQTLVTAVAVLILAGGAYLLAPRDADEPTAPAPTEPVREVPALTPPQPSPAAAISAAPDIPKEEPESAPDPAPETDVAVEAPAPAPPTPEELDQTVRSTLEESGFDPAPALADALAAPFLLDRGVSSIDQIARGLVPKRALNLAPPAGAFGARRDGDRYFVDPAGYRRYDGLVSALTALPADTGSELFQQLRPLLDDAYAALGYPADMMDNTLIAALDAVIAAPVRESPPELRSKGALWAYDDPELENASDLHKQMLRLGPENTRALQSWAAAFRAALLER